MMITYPSQLRVPTMELHSIILSSKIRVASRDKFIQHWTRANMDSGEQIGQLMEERCQGPLKRLRRMYF